MAEILFLNGPNLGRLGTRKPEIYGRTTLAEIEAAASMQVRKAGHELVAEQSNSETELIDLIELHTTAAGLVLNPGALMLSGWSLRDALEDFAGVKIEVHISNIWAREPFRHVSVLSGVVNGVVAGLGVDGYRIALDHVLVRLKAG